MEVSQTISNAGIVLFSSEYKEYFSKSPGAKVVQTRGTRRLSDYVDFDLSHHKSNCHSSGFCLNDTCNIVNMIRQKENGFMLIDEGLIATYPTRKLFKHFKLCFKKIVKQQFANATFPGTSAKIEDFSEMSDTNENISPLVMICVPSEDDVDIKRLVAYFTNEFAKYGYYMTSYDINDVHTTSGFDLVYIQFEAKYTNMLVNIVDTLYHVTPLKYAQKVFAQGLVPYSKSKNFKYAPRVYLFNKCPQQQVFDYGVYKTVEQHDDGFCIFKLRKDKLLNDPIFKDGKQKFYLDPAFSIDDNHTDQTAIFTYGNIPLRILEKEYVEVTVDDAQIKDIRMYTF